MPRTLHTLLCCDAKNLGVDAEYLVLFLSLSISKCQWENSQSFPSICLLIYKVRRMRPRESDQKQGVKTLLKRYDTILSLKTCHHDLYIPFDIHIICNDIFLYFIIHAP